MNDRELESLESILDACLIYRSELKPSNWYETNMIMPQGSAFPGPIKYSKTPFWREPVDCADPNHPARDITIMGPAQMGKSVMVLNPLVGYTISENPGNILFLTGHTELTKKAVVKIDGMIHNCGLSKLIKPSYIKARNNRTGDTALEKEFRGGNFIAGSVTNHNLMRQNDVMISVADDLDAGEMDKKDTGDTVDLIKGRTKAFENKAKRYWVSSPQIKGKSLIEKQFLLSDQRYYYIPCDCCHEKIALSLRINVTDKDVAGLHWELDKMGRVDQQSVGYICQSCGNFFTDQNKGIWLNEGEWRPTCEPQEYYHYGYHINGLYAPHGMTSWFTLAEKYQLCHPPGEEIKKRKYQTFLNIDIGDPYEETGESPKANDLQRNKGKYEIGIIPNSVSKKDGNGQIILLTCAVDMNGKIEDARLDYEIVGWSETGSSYSISHGSIGTFILAENQQKIKEDRVKWTYDHFKTNSVWPELEKILDTVYDTDDGIRQMSVFVTGLDTGHFTTGYAYPYLDKSTHWVIGLKGKDADKYIRFGMDLPTFRAAKERSNLYLVEVGRIKDELADLMKLKYDQKLQEKQPHGFMNFPIPSKGLYQFENYFSHFEAEHKVTTSKDGEPISSKWEKKTSSHQNHFWDCRIYNMVIKDILVHQYCIKYKFKNPTWSDYVDIFLGRIKK